jgi:tetratricopeptide (TPR) repeat protein
MEEPEDQRDDVGHAAASPTGLKFFSDPKRSLIIPGAIRRSMSDLVEAIEAEARGDFAKALPHYAKLTESGSALDRVGIFQALARCNEKLGRLKDAGAWRRKAGQAYLALKDHEMARDERQYLALVEYRNAVQDLHGDPSLGEVAKEYAAVLKDNFSGGAEGLTHEGLFAGAFFRTLGDHLTAAKYFFDTAEVMSEQATTGSDPILREATILAYERAMDSATKAGRADVARVAQMRAYDLKQMK